MATTHRSHMRLALKLVRSTKLAELSQLKLDMMSHDYIGAFTTDNKHPADVLTQKLCDSFVSYLKSTHFLSDTKIVESMINYCKRHMSEYLIRIIKSDDLLAELSQIELEIDKQPVI